MHKSFSGILLGWLLITVFSCNEVKLNVIPGKPGLFNLPVFMREQTDLLKNLDVTVSKTTWINDKPDEVFFRADTGYWRRDFDLISSTDISQPGLYDRYRTLTADSSGFSVTIYDALDHKINGTSYMRIIRDGSGKIRNIEIHQQDNNFLYHNHRIMNLWFEDSQGRFPGILEEYSISGAQKIVLRKEVRYKISVALDIKG